MLLVMTRRFGPALLMSLMLPVGTSCATDADDFGDDPGVPPDRVVEPDPSEPAGDASTDDSRGGWSDANGEPDEDLPAGYSALSGKVDPDSGAGGLYGGAEGPAKEVYAYEVKPGGALSLLAHGQVAIDGSFTLWIPASKEKVVLVALDAKAEVIAQGIVDSTGKEGKKTACSPLNLETSLEALVFLEIVDLGVDPKKVDTISLKAKITLPLAIAVAVELDIKAKVHALAKAIVLAQAVELEVYAAAGLVISHHQIFESSLAAAAALDAKLHAGVTYAKAHEEFHAELQAAITAMVGVTLHAKAKAAATATLAASLHFCLKEKGKGKAVVAAAISASVAASLHGVVKAVAKTLADLGASSSDIQILFNIVAGVKMGVELKVVVALLADLSAAIAAKNGILVSLLAEAVLLLELDLLSVISVDATADLHAAIKAAIFDATKKDGSLDPALAAKFIVKVFASFKSTVKTELSALGILDVQLGSKSAVQAAAHVLVLLGALKSAH